jgi:transcriptional regulator with XRE-family HTH domain
MPRPPNARRKPAKGALFPSGFVATNIRAYRALRRLTQADLADRMRLLDLNDAWDQTTVSRVEKGERNVSVDELVGVALALGTTIPDLLDPTGPDGTSSTELDYGAKGTLAARKASMWLWGALRVEMKVTAKGGPSFSINLGTPKYGAPDPKTSFDVIEEIAGSRAKRTRYRVEDEG